MQTRDTFKNTVELTKKLSPERITLIKYSHLPNKRKHMKMIKEEDLPNIRDLPYMFTEATNSFIQDGYTWVGIDHFAKTTDELSIAAKEKKIGRNFGGEHPGYTTDIMGLGPTTTSAFGKYYFQSTYDLHEYREKIGKGIFPISKAYTLNQDDEIRRDCNYSLQCNQELNINEIERKYNISFSDYFPNELLKLKKYEKHGLVDIKNNEIKVTNIGRYFVIKICQIFDTFIGEDGLYEVHGP